MENKEMPEESIISVPSSAGNVDGIVRQDPTPFRRVWATVSTFTIEVVKFTLMWIAGVVLMPLLPSFLLALTWKGVFIVSCLAVSFDSLFLYIPVIDQEHKCLGTDMTLRNVALALRSFTDLTFIFHIIFLFSDGMEEGPKWRSDSSSAPIDVSRLSIRLNIARKAMTKKISWLSFPIIINFVAILPFPQVAIIVGFFRMGGSRHFFKPPIINMFLICQNFLRCSQIILSIKKIDTVGKWVKGSSYFLLYFIASHVIAAFWYFFSIQREISCWDQTCRTIAGCMPVYDCGRNTSLNSTFLNQSCPIDSSNATTFDFGMYRAILKSGNTGHTNFLKKLFYYFWWSLKNLSNFGTNLETSSYIWENCFAILICVIGLLLFIILIGNVQTYIQSETEKSLKIGEARRTKLASKYMEIEKWMLIHGVPDNMKNYFWRNIKEDKVVEFIDEDVDIEFVRRSYPKSYSADEFESDPVIFICVNALKKVSLLRNMDEQVLNAFCKYSSTFGDPDYITKDKDSYITGAGKPLETLYLIIDGTIEDVQTGRRLDCCGEEVLRWAILNYKKSKEHRDRLPISTVGVKCLTKTGAFTFTADQLIKVLKKLKNSEQLAMEEALQLAPDISKTDRGIKDWLLRNGFPEDLKANIMKFLVEKSMDDDVDVDVVFLFGILPENIKSSIKRHLGMNALKKVPMLQKMHEYVLEIICNHLEPVVYRMDSYIVRSGEPLSFIIFILGGKVIITDTNSSNEITEPSDENVLERGVYYGEQLLSWASPNNISSSDNPVKSARDVKCGTKVEALMLKADDLKSVASRCGSQWNFNSYCMDFQQLVADGRDHVTSTTPTFSIEETIRLHQGHDIILEQLVLIRETIFRRLEDQGRRLEDQGRRLDEMAAFLARVG